MIEEMLKDNIEIHTGVKRDEPATLIESSESYSFLPEQVEINWIESLISLKIYLNIAVT